VADKVALVRVLEIENFRAIKRLRWLPGERVNCLVGAGASGESTILDAIDLCVGARRSFVLADAGFPALDFDDPSASPRSWAISRISSSTWRPMADYHVGFKVADGTILSEPDVNLETALTLQLTVDRDLEPQRTRGLAPRIRPQPDYPGCGGQNVF
jgi:putative ATP-dependent endonuclease of the OLD family